MMQESENQSLWQKLRSWLLPYIKKQTVKSAGTYTVKIVIFFKSGKWLEIVNSGIFPSCRQQS